MSPKNSFVLKEVLLVDPASGLDGSKKSMRDLWVQDGRIHAIDLPGQISAGPEVPVISGQGRILIPGLIDMHVHLREPGFENKETVATGTRAAILGGFTSVACMANTQPVHDHPVVTRFILDRAKIANQARVFPIGAVTKGMKGEVLAEIGGMIEAGCVAISDDGLPIMNSYLMRRAMEYAKTFGVPIISHAEDLNLSAGGSMNEGATSALLGLRGNPKASEEIMVAREIALARLTGASVHIAHLSTREGLEQVRRAKEAGLSVTAEVTPHHLLLNDSDLGQGKHFYCTHHKMAPPLRTESDQAALLDGIQSGLIDVIASDHAPHGCVDKEVEFELAAMGILGLQTTLPLMLGLVHAQKLTWIRLVQLLSTGPAKILKLERLGSLKVGFWADLTLIDPNEAWTLTSNDLVSKSQNSPFVGRDFRGQVKTVWVAGEEKFRN